MAGILFRVALAVALPLLAVWDSIALHEFSHCWLHWDDQDACVVTIYSPLADDAGDRPGGQALVPAGSMAWWEHPLIYAGMVLRPLLAAAAAWMLLAPALAPASRTAWPK